MSEPMTTTTEPRLRGSVMTPPTGVPDQPSTPMLPPDHPQAPDLPRTPFIDPVTDTPAPVQDPPRPPEAEMPAIRTIDPQALVRLSSIPAFSLLTATAPRSSPPRPQTPTGEPPSAGAAQDHRRAPSSRLVADGMHQDDAKADAPRPDVSEPDRATSNPPVGVSDRE